MYGNEAGPRRFPGGVGEPRDQWGDLDALLAMHHRDVPQIIEEREPTALLDQRSQGVVAIIIDLLFVFCFFFLRLYWSYRKEGTYSVTPWTKFAWVLFLS
jgi:hypothetical protein